MIKPMDDKIIVKALTKKENVINGILIPESVKQEAESFEVIAVNDNETDLNVGDIVIIDKSKAVSLKIDDEDVLTVKKEDILGLIFN